MGLVRTPLTLSDPREPDMASMAVDAPAGTGAVHPFAASPKSPDIPASVAMGVRDR